MKTKTEKDYTLEYEDFGGRGMYVFGIISMIAVLIVLVILAIMMIYGGSIIIQELSRWKV